MFLFWCVPEQEYDCVKNLKHPNLLEVPYRTFALRHHHRSALGLWGRGLSRMLVNGVPYLRPLALINAFNLIKFISL